MIGERTMPCAPCNIPKPLQVGVLVFILIAFAACSSNDDGNSDNNKDNFTGENTSISDTNVIIENDGSGENNRSDDGEENTTPDDPQSAAYLDLTGNGGFTFVDASGDRFRIRAADVENALLQVEDDNGNLIDNLIAGYPSEIAGPPFIATIFSRHGGDSNSADALLVRFEPLLDAEPYVVILNIADFNNSTVIADILLRTVDGIITSCVSDCERSGPGTNASSCLDVVVADNQIGGELEFRNNCDFMVAYSYCYTNSEFFTCQAQPHSGGGFRYGRGGSRVEAFGTNTLPVSEENTNVVFYGCHIERIGQFLPFLTSISPPAGECL